MKKFYIIKCTEKIFEINGFFHLVNYNALMAALCTVDAVIDGSRID